MSEKVGIFKAIGNFFRDVRAELRKVVYPTAKQVVRNTIVVIVYILVVGTLIAALDGAFGWGRKALFAWNNSITSNEVIDWSNYELQDEESADTAPEGTDVDTSNTMEVYVDENGNMIPIDDMSEVPPTDEGSTE